MAKAVETPALYVVLDSFVTESGVYRKGEAVHPDDPMIAQHPAAFGPFVFAHPVKHVRVAEPKVEQATAAPGEKRATEKALADKVIVKAAFAAKPDVESATAAPGEKRGA